MKPVSAVLTSVTEPTISTALLSSPVSDVASGLAASLIFPCDAVRVALTSCVPASRSATLNVSDFGESSVTLAEAGTVFTGASFTALTVRPIESVSVFAPPAPV
ncbi:MAG: hypothetical protein AVDCRST_MAG85-3418 [uncultured Solirubrobacteraceae bacterium]|uniref:Uncharacterized protein n=1 Tax=uncultured Solirubrobacteraceae bacterium TaxID=1162706 RepID=A0A6J4TQM0_9ACTN|nr:MAG: hypothetical protein AVDCRST_MAG85-3418 [uncultured Solirubrobacteraceae bacterium]